MLTLADATLTISALIAGMIAGRAVMSMDATRRLEPMWIIRGGLLLTFVAVLVVWVSGSWWLSAAAMVVAGFGPRHRLQARLGWCWRQGWPSWWRRSCLASSPPSTTRHWVGPAGSCHRPDSALAPAQGRQLRCLQPLLRYRLERSHGDWITLDSEWLARWPLAKRDRRARSQSPRLRHRVVLGYRTPRLRRRSSLPLQVHVACERRARG